MKSNKKSKKSPKTKKELVLGNTARRVNPFIIVITIALFGAAAGAAYLVWTAPAHTASPAATPVAATPVAAAPASGLQEVAYPLSLFNDGQARHFEHKSGGSVIRYFILKSSDGIVRAAFDACDVCWPGRKGYVQNGDEMVCNNCGRRFASVLINEVQGGCNPAPLTRTIEGDRLVIRTNDIEQGQRYFNF
ncbi:MAG: DUF2318 domain-containing protein [Desulfobacteraceae bacterium]|nr:MAG: DUF2318 domain-containing protein [Desulfobacteraceae bacterium]